MTLLFHGLAQTPIVVIYIRSQRSYDSPKISPPTTLEHDLLNSIFDGLNLTAQLLGFVGSDTRSNDGARDAAGSAKGSFGRNEDVWNVLYRGYWDIPDFKVEYNIPCPRKGEEDGGEFR